MGSKGGAGGVDRSLRAAVGGGSAGSGSNTNKASSGTGPPAPDGVLSITPDSPADSEWRARRGPLDAADGGPWGEEDAAGTPPHTSPPPSTSRAAGSARPRPTRPHPGALCRAHVTGFLTAALQVLELG